MPRKEEIEELLEIYYRRLHELKKRRALQGINVDPSILIEIEEIEKTIRDQLKEWLLLLPDSNLDAAEDKLKNLREQLIDSASILNQLKRGLTSGQDDHDIIRELAQINARFENEQKPEEIETRLKEVRNLSELLEKMMPVAGVSPHELSDDEEFDFPYGAVKPESKSYIERDADRLCWLHIKQRWGSTIFIKAPRQLGKSSLIRRILYRAEKEGTKKSAFINFQSIPQYILEDQHSFLIEFCSMIAASLGVPDAIERFWSPQRQGSSSHKVNPIRKCSEYLSKYLIPQLNDPFVLALDEVDRMLTTPFRSDFFRMLRTWHNDRVENKSFAKMTLFLSCSADPALFIENPEESPFNVAEVIELEDFSNEKVEELNWRQGAILQQTEIEDLIEMVGGHPFLVRVAFYEIKTGRETLSSLLKKGLEGRGTYGHHLNQIISPLLITPELKETLNNICQRQHSAKNRIFYRLKSLGLIKEKDNQVMFRNKLYEQYFCNQLLKST